MIRRAFLVFLVFGVTACGDDSTGPESGAGTYTLLSVDGDALPWVLLQILGDKVEITAGSMVLNQDLTCSSSITSSVTESGDVTTVTETDVCAYTFNNGAITVTDSSDNSTVSGSIVGSQLTLTIEGSVFIYRNGRWRPGGV